MTVPYITSLLTFSGSVGMGVERSKFELIKCASHLILESSPIAAGKISFNLSRTEPFPCHKYCKATSEVI